MKKVPLILMAGLLTSMLIGCRSLAPSTPPRAWNEIDAKFTLDSYCLALYSKRDADKTRHFTFRRRKGSYSLVENTTGRSIRRNVFYKKTSGYEDVFGGEFPMVNVHVINSRFVVFPETIKGSEMPGEPFNSMKAVTRIYDLKGHRLLPTGIAYRYTHNAPLRYDVEPLLSLIKEEQSR